MNIKKTLCLLLFAAGFLPAAKGQSFAVKTNLLYDATATANAGIELALAPRWTFDLSGNYNAWPIDGQKWKHWMAQPELRYWFCDRYSRHFLGVHALGGRFNVGNIAALKDVRFLGIDFSNLADYRYQGWGAGAGIAYGYAFILGRHWNLELELGAGYVYLEYDKYRCEDCARHAGSGHNHYVGPTKAAINLVYVF